ncbi:MAG: hypothetical protein KAQ83_01905 [Nanoarchaeota archaeon]|nr:hypothetical protein [Nanoarchaeota archaeon]
MFIIILITRGIQQGENKTTEFTGCGVCLFNVNVFAEYQINGMNETFKKNISSYFDSPMNLLITRTN